MSLSTHRNCGMNRRSVMFRGCLLFLAVQSVGAYAQRKPDVVSIGSPNGKVRIEVFFAGSDLECGQLRYRVMSQDRPIILPSSLGVKLAENELLGANCRLIKQSSQEVAADFEQFPGKRRQVKSRCHETTIWIQEQTGNRKVWQLVVRAYDDGVAFRYRFPKSDDWQQLRLVEESTEFNFPAEASATWLPLANFTTSHEARYLRSAISKMSSDTLIGLPLLIELPGPAWAAVLEANLTDYAGLYLSHPNPDASALVSRLSPRVDGSGLAVQATLPHESPWRVVLVTDRLEQLIDSDTILALNAPCALEDVSWIKPGKTTFPWWNDYFEQQVSFTPGLNTQTAQHYIDFCAEHGIEYHSLDGVRDTAWYGGPIVPYEGADITQAVDGLDLPTVLDYARQKGVRLRLWMHWQAARQHMARAFPLYQKWGIEGVMIDFMDRDDQEMVNFQHELLQLAAKHRLTVTFHGVSAPTGLERTYPHLLNSEAVMNLEYDKWEPLGIPPDHDVTVACTRMLGGPLDYHQGSLRGVTSQQFRPQNAAPLVIGTPCRMLATYIVFQNHLPMVADYPSAYRSSPLTRILAEIPATWDDTRVLAAKSGEIVAIARRSADEWWIGAITDDRPRDLALPLTFLNDGRYRAEVYQDALAAPHRFKQHACEVSASDTLTIQLAAAGGALLRLSPAASSPPGCKLAWSDDFDTWDDQKWMRHESYQPTNRSLQAYLPEQVSVHNGRLEIRADNRAVEQLSYRSGQVTSKFAQRFGRWEVRAKVAGSRGIWPVIRLEPSSASTSRGEIVIMQGRGDQPTITSSAFQWTGTSPNAAGSRSIEQQTSLAGKLVSYPEDFHTYAVEWHPDQLRFYVDDVYHTIFYNDEVGNFLPRLELPMRLVIETAVGGDSQPPPDATTIWPQRMLVDWVRVYSWDEADLEHEFTNGDFEASGGTLAGWHVFGNRIKGDPNILAHNAVVKKGTTALKLSGQSSGDENYSGVSHGISVNGAARIRARLAALVSSTNGLANSQNRAYLKIEFYDRWGDYFGGPAMLAAVERIIADASTSTDEWIIRELTADVPPGAVEARLSIVFAQPRNELGAVYVDAVELDRQFD